MTQRADVSEKLFVIYIHCGVCSTSRSSNIELKTLMCRNRELVCPVAYSYFHESKGWLIRRYVIFQRARVIRYGPTQQPGRIRNAERLDIRPLHVYPVTADLVTRNVTYTSGSILGLDPDPAHEFEITFIFAGVSRGP